MVYVVQVFLVSCGNSMVMWRWQCKRFSWFVRRFLMQLRVVKLSFLNAFSVAFSSVVASPGHRVKYISIMIGLKGIEMTPPDISLHIWMTKQEFGDKTLLYFALPLPCGEWSSSTTCFPRSQVLNETKCGRTGFDIDLHVTYNGKLCYCVKG